TMTNRELIALTGAAISKRQGQRRAIKTAQPCRAWARRHQDLLRAAFRRPDVEVSIEALRDGVAAEDLRAMGFVEIEVTRWDDARQRAFTERRWSHRSGDDHGVRVLVGLVDGRAEHADAEHHAATMLHELNAGRGRIAR